MDFLNAQPRINIEHHFVTSPPKPKKTKNGARVIVHWIGHLLTQKSLSAKSEALCTADICERGERERGEWLNIRDACSIGALPLNYILDPELVVVGFWV